MLFRSVLLKSGDDVVLTKYSLGKGEVYFLNAPIERVYTSRYDPTSTDMCEVYKLFFDGVSRPITLDSKKCCVTYHETENATVKVLVTRFDDRCEIPYTLDQKYEIIDTKYCKNVNNTLKFAENYACIELKKK